MTSERIADLDAYRRLAVASRCWALPRSLKKLKNPRLLPPHPIALLVIGAGCRAKPKVAPAQHEHGVK